MEWAIYSVPTQTLQVLNTLFVWIVFSSDPQVGLFLPSSCAVACLLCASSNKDHLKGT